MRELIASKPTAPSDIVRFSGHRTKMLLLGITAFIILVISWLYYVSNKQKKFATYFKEQGVKCMRPGFFSGDVTFFTFWKQPMWKVFADFCRQNPEEPFLGYYDHNSAYLLVQNADYLEKIFIKDFSHFVDHGFDDFINKTKNPFDESLFAMNGSKWRAFRYKLSPLFTSGKLKNMFSSMERYSDSLIELLKSKDHEDYEINEAARLFSMDVIGSSIFGLETNVMKNPNSEYNRIGMKALNKGIFDLLKFYLVAILPGFIVRWFGWSLNKKEVIEYFSKIVKETLDHRRKNNIQRSDVVQLLLQLKEKGKIEITSWDSNDDYLKSDHFKVTDTFEVSDEIITVQAFTFLVGGFDPLALAIMYTCFELTQHPEIQDRVRSEVSAQVASHSGLTYEALKCMTYLENVVKETLRMHTVLPIIMRICTKDYTFPNGYTIRKGEKLFIPSVAVHYNPNYFSEPELFKPERFEQNIKPGTYLPFGEGPRICLGMRFALLHIKMGVAAILKNYKLKLNPKTVLPLKCNATTFFQYPVQKILFDLIDATK